MLATGGIGRAYTITSNSWEYTGDGHALAYHAGAELQDMEFVQFHPTGMVWPPSVRGILVTEGVRGEGGVLLNRDGKRFMFDDIPENYRNQTADNEEEGWRYTQGDKTARRPPELLTRDHVARCIMREVREGRGSPHGGVFLDISWIKRKLPNAAEHIKRKLPSMYHQFKQLADIDITKKPMEVGPTTHYIMGGVRVDGDTQMSTVPGLFAAGECAAGLHGANRLGGNSLSDLLVFGKRAGEHAAAFAQRARRRPGRLGGGGRGRPRRAGAVRSGRRPPMARGRTRSSTSCRTMMQEPGRHRADRGRDGAGARGHRAVSASRRGRVGVGGNREYNPGWHTALDLREPADGLRGGRRAPRSSGRRAAAAISARTIPEKDPGVRQGQHRGAQRARTAACSSSASRSRPMPAGAAGRSSRKRSSGADGNRDRDVPHLARRRGRAAQFEDYTTECTEGMVVLDAIHQIQADRPTTWPCRWNCKAGKCGSCSAEINGKPQADVHDPAERAAAGQAGHRRADAAFPPIRDLVTDVSWNFAVKKTIKPFKPRPPDAPDGTWRMDQADVDRVQEFRKCIECFLCQDVCHVLRDHSCTSSSSARASWYTSPRSRCTRSTSRTACRI